MNPLDDTRDGAGNPNDPDRIERRTLLKGLAAGLAGGLAASESPAATTDVRTEQPGATLPATSPSNLPRLLDDHQRRTLSSLAEVLVPGSVAAGVVDLMDRVAAIDTATSQRRLLNAIARFDQEAQSAHGQPWNDLDDALRLAMLRRASEAAAASASSPSGQPTNVSTLPAQFEYLRNAVATAYFRTEAGMKERGWTGRTAWTELPGCQHPLSGHE